MSDKTANWRDEFDDLVRTYGPDHVGASLGRNTVGESTITLTVTRTVETVILFAGNSLEANRLFNEILYAIQQANRP